MNEKRLKKILLKLFGDNFSYDSFNDIFVIKIRIGINLDDLNALYQEFPNNYKCEINYGMYDLTLIFTNK